MNDMFHKLIFYVSAGILLHRIQKDNNAGKDAIYHILFPVFRFREFLLFQYDIFSFFVSCLMDFLHNQTITTIC